MLALRNNFDILQEISETPTPNDEYENFVNAYLESAAEYIPTKQRAKRRVPWETLVGRKKRADVKIACQRNMKNLTNIKNQNLEKAQNELITKIISNIRDIKRTLTKRMGKKLDGNYARMLRTVLKQDPHKKAAVRPPTTYHEKYQS